MKKEIKLSKQNIKLLERIKTNKKLFKEYQDVINNEEQLKKYKSITSLIKEYVKKVYIEEQKEKLKNNKTIKEVILGDALDNLKKMKSNFIPLVITDPPYGIDFSHSWSSQNNIKNDSANYINEYLPLVFKELNRIMTNDAHIYVFSSFKNYPEFVKMFEQYFDLHNCIVWVKNNSSLCDFDKKYGFSHEFILFGTKKGKKPTRLLQHQEGKMTKDVIFNKRVSNPDHSCQKPIDLIEKLILTSSFEKEIVLDPFAGSGSTLIAAKNLNRNYVGIEYDEKWWALIQEKLQNIKKDKN